jgi:hypothetical protein
MEFTELLARRYVERRFTILFAALLLSIAGHAFVGELLPVVNPLDWLLGLSLVAVVLSAQSAWTRITLGGLALGFVAARLVQPLLDHPAPLVVGQTSLAIACLLATGVAGHRALASGPVDGERIFAAIDVYLLVGVAFGVGYWLIEAALPGSLTEGSGGALTPPRAVYFSFVTQATLGYGDIVPIREHVQGVVGGQMYLAVLIARLVSLYSAQARA